MSLKNGCRINLDAKIVYQELEQIRQTHNNRIQAVDVINYARENPNSELYKGFEWNDSIAAEEFRKQQAAKIIYNIKVTKLENPIEKDEPMKPIVYSPYTHLNNEVGYRSTIEIFKEQDSYEILKQQALNDLIYWRTKYASITELKTIFDEIDMLKI